MVLGRFVLVIGVLGSLVGCSTGPGSPQEVVINIEHSRFDPSRLVFEEGAEVTFLIHNNDPIDHEFILGDEEVQQVHEEGTESHHGAKPGEVSIPAGESRRTTFTFGSEGQLIYGCHLPGHYDYGMKGTVRVT